MDRTPIKNRSVKEITEADKIARFYGFQPIVPPAVEKQDIDFVKNFDETHNPAEKAALFRMYFEEKMIGLPQPNMFFCERPFRQSKGLLGQRKKPSQFENSLISIGSFKSVCECLSIQTGINILKNIGYKNIEIHLNSIGDKESASEFQKKLTVFIRKNFNDFPADLRQIIKKDPFAILRQEKKEWQEFEAECPKFIDFLSESSRLHFKEILEFLEIMEIPYQINHHLVSDFDMGSETVFAIKSDDEELAFGFRFNRLAKKIGYKKDIPATILNISAKLKKKLKKVKARDNKPDFYLIQFGPEAKLKSFLVLEELHKAGASVIHSIAKDKLGSQISIAENSEAPHIILIGQKEALENSVVIRNTSTRAQEIVPISELAQRAKELLKS